MANSNFDFTYKKLPVFGFFPQWQDYIEVKLCEPRKLMVGTLRDKRAYKILPEFKQSYFNGEKLVIECSANHTRQLHELGHFIFAPDELALKKDFGLLGNYFNDYTVQSEQFAFSFVNVMWKIPHRERKFRLSPLLRIIFQDGTTSTKTLHKKLVYRFLGADSSNFDEVMPAHVKFKIERLRKIWFYSGL